MVFAISKANVSADGGRNGGAWGGSDNVKERKEGFDATRRNDAT